MVDVIAIVVGVVTGVGAITGATYKIYADCRNRDERQQQEIIIHEPDRLPSTVVPPTPPPSPTFDRMIKKVIDNHMEKQRDSEDSDTEIDIRIHIQSHNYEQFKKENKERE